MGTRTAGYIPNLLPPVSHPIQYSSTAPSTTLTHLPHILHTSRFHHLPSWSKPPASSYLGAIHLKTTMMQADAHNSMAIEHYRRILPGGREKDTDGDAWYVGENILTNAPPANVADAHFPGEGQHKGRCTRACVRCADWAEYEVYAWPGEDLTVRLKRRLAVDLPIERGWQRWRIISTRRAARLVHKIMNADMQLRKIDEGETMQVLDSHALVPWATTVMETFKGGKYRRVTVTGQGDDTVFAAFWKKGRGAAWENVELKEVVGLKAVDKKEYRISICGVPESVRDGEDEYDEQEEDNADEGVGLKWDWRMAQGTLWLENTTVQTPIARSLYQIVDDEDKVPDEKARKVELLESTFRKKNWKMANVIYRDDTADKVVLWVCVDENNVICDRIVAKYFPIYLELDDELSNAYAQSNLKTGEPLGETSDPDGGLRKKLKMYHEDVERELRDHSNLHLLEDRHVVGLCGASMRVSATGKSMLERCVMFLEYTEHGDLAGFIEWWKSVAKKNVPEVFVWLVLKSLVSACLAVEELGLVHHDIKPPNIFLKSSIDEWRGFPQPVLGDFGNLIPSAEGASEFGTQGFLAPEQVAVDREHQEAAWDEEATAPFHPSTKLHVFAIGQVAWCTMRLKPLSELDEHNAQPPFPWEDPNAASSTYSYRLEKLIEDCRQVDRHKRPTLQDVRLNIDGALASLEKRYPGIKRKSEEEMPEWWRAGLPDDEFAVGGDVWEAIERRKRRKVPVRSTDERTRNMVVASGPDQGERNAVVAATYLEQETMRKTHLGEDEHEHEWEEGPSGDF